MLKQTIKYWVGRLTPHKKRQHKKEMEFYSQFIEKHDLCFDVGANMGSKTSKFLKLGAKVVSIEPQEACLKKLYKLFKNNKNVVIVGEALGEREGYEDLSICEDEPTISTMSPKWQLEGRFSKDYQWTKTQQIRTTTLDALVQLYGIPKFCKIDVEGYEKSVLKGLTKPIYYLSFEFTREFFEDAIKCIDHLVTIGRVEFNCSVGNSMELLFSTWVEPQELYEKLNFMEDPRLWGDIYAKFY